MKDISMKLAWTIVAAITAVSSFPLTAQQADLAMQQATSTAAGAMQASESSKIDANAAAQLRPVNGEHTD
jgi:hypothetical protein